MATDHVLTEVGPPFWCVGIADVRTRKPCGRVIRPSAPPALGWQPLCARCLRALQKAWEAERHAELWNDRVRDDVVYIAAREGFFKVGKSARGYALRSRLDALGNRNDPTIRPKRMTPGPLELLAVFPGSYHEESRLQMVLMAGGYGAGGEWFIRSDYALLAAIDWLLEPYSEELPVGRRVEVDVSALIAEVPATEWEFSERPCFPVSGNSGA